ncbi:hypothetical protein [Parendozoicomonas sp. Alg238-R29]|uniref:hypothetical protein n=1 Tax=Parendozoicomonas sp. Alg238-R29 TaxID=2993446 RepID=UPI00248DA8FF|nr:hypothetical protein [Parendozoicomonas sp. Alg238-R29]
MTSIVEINGNTFEEKGGKLFLNGNEIKHNIVKHTKPIYPAFISGFATGVAFLVIITELAARL